MTEAEETRLLKELESLINSVAITFKAQNNVNIGIKIGLLTLKDHLAEFLTFREIKARA